MAATLPQQEGRGEGEGMLPPSSLAPGEARGSIGNDDVVDAAASAATFGGVLPPGGGSSSSPRSPPSSVLQAPPPPSSSPPAPYIETTLYKERDKVSHIRLCSLAPPHMRNFHLAWFSFFMAFLAWFAHAPLMPVIKRSLKLTEDQVNYSHLASTGSTVFIRLLIGGWVDVYGPKTSMAVLLLVGAIPFFFVIFLRGWVGLVVLRAFIGLLGASFVMCQAWTTAMFRREVVGQANALAAGWGNLGGAVTQALMVEIFDGLQTWGGQDEENAWRLSFLFPGCLLILTAALVSYYGTDTPRGDVSERIEKGEKPTEAIASLSDAACNPMTWVLALQYAISFGVELVVYNMAASYFHEEFHTPVLQAGKVAAYAGVTNLFARAMGGWLSDMANTRWGIKGRMWVQFTLLIFESFFLLWFAYAASYKEAIVLLLVFSIFVQAANGSCFALVPYLSNQSGGSVAGIVGSGGNVGSVIFTLVFIYGQFEKRATGFAVMGGSVLAASLSLWLIDPEQLEQGHRLVDSSMHSIKSEGEGEQEGQGKGMEAVVIH